MPEPIDERSDAELITSAQAGDNTAFGGLVRRYQRAAVRVAAVAIGSATDADDVAQEAFMRAHAAIHRFKPGAPFQPWLFRIVTNTARNQMRGRGRHRALVVRAGNRATLPDATAPEIVELRDDASTVIAAINRLGSDDRTVLLYRWYEDFSESEMADALGCRPGTVKSRLSRAMNRLRAELGEP